MSMQNGVENEKSCSARIRSLIGADEKPTAFARRVHLKQAAIDRYIKGLREPNAEALRAISSSCGVSSDYLLGISDTPNGESNSDWRSRAVDAETELRRYKSAFAKLAKPYIDIIEVSACGTQARS